MSSVGTQVFGPAYGDCCRNLVPLKHLTNPFADVMVIVWAVDIITPISKVTRQPAMEIWYHWPWQSYLCRDSISKPLENQTAALQTRPPDMGIYTTN